MVTECFIVLVLIKISWAVFNNFLKYISLFKVRHMAIEYLHNDIVPIHIAILSCNITPLLHFASTMNMVETEWGGTS